MGEGHCGWPKRSSIVAMKEMRPDNALASDSQHLAFPILRVKAIVFDMDGVLVDSVPLQMEAFRVFFATYPSGRKSCGGSTGRQPGRSCKR